MRKLYNKSSYRYEVLRGNKVLSRHMKYDAAKKAAKASGATQIHKIECNVFKMSWP